MPLDAARLDELKANIALARKRPLAFGLCIGKSAETTVLLNHKTKDPETVGRQAKKEGETSKLAFGMMTVEGKSLLLCCHSDVVAGLARKTKEMLKAAGLKMKVCILDIEGNLIEADEDEDDQGGPAAPAPELLPPDPQREKWEQSRPRVESLLAKALAEGKADLSQADASWQEALAMAAADDFSAAVQVAADTVKLIAAALEAGRAAGADREKWLATAAKLETIIAALGAPKLPEAAKVAAYWAFAKSKATAPVPDFATALKTVPQIVKLIAEIRAKMQGGTSGSSAPPPPETVGGAPPVTREENARLTALPDDELAKTDLTVGDTTELFSEDYMLRLKDAPIKGEGNPSLKALMREVEKGLSGPRRAEVMEELAQIVGIPPTAEKLDTDYDRFLVVRKQQSVKGKQKKEEVPGLDEKMHPDFLGSRSQLMFGKVLGDAFGIHEIFAALLSPTGGLVGPGNWLIPNVVKAGHLAPDNPVALHGTVHDAAGYLLTFHDEGPGYNYRDSDIEILGSDSPLSGQVSGIAYWVKEAGPDYVEKRVDALVLEVEKKLTKARDTVAAEIEKRIAQVEDAAEELADAAEETATEIADAIEEAADQAEESIVEAIDSGIEKLGEVRDTAKKKLEAAWDFLTD